ncbi:putative aquaporin transporter [Lupinus albus]|uniref:Putative aquaporin transporter n=1 Tax=Lupinus albus TaxID=3870 RepID=A0A6A4P2D4_LUPAL|nr:putative aquaporin transporter [Lupinus albus]
MALDGASFNPSTTVTFYIENLKPHSTLTSMVIRALDSKALLLLVMPSHYNQMLKGPFLKDDLHIGTIIEGGRILLLT